MSTTTNVTSLVINKLTKAQYEAIQNPDPTQLYFIIDDNEYAEVSDLPQPSNTTPLKDGTAAAGVAATYSRSDHVHPAELPSQSGQSGKFLTTNGTTASWVDNPPEIFWVNVTENYDSQTGTTTYSADKTVAEIYAAIQSGKLPVVKYDSEIHQLTAVYHYQEDDSTDIDFSYIDSNVVIHMWLASNYGGSDGWFPRVIEPLDSFMQKGVDYVTAGQKSGTTLGTKATAEGNATTASGDYSHAEGNNTKATNTNAHAEGYSTTASGLYSHAEGVQTTASGDRSHAEGNNSIASGSNSHAEGVTTLATSDNAHAEGQCTTASNSSAHSEGSHSIASGQQAHAEGKYTNAFGGQSHAEGEGIKYDVVLTASGTEKSYNVTTSNVYIPNNIPTSGWRLFDPVYAKKWYTVQGTTLDGRNLTRISLTEELSSAVTQNGSTCYLVLTGAHYGYSHTEGQGSISGSIAQHVGGKFNEVVVGAEVIGGGSDNANRENIRVLDWSGNETLAGTLTIGGANGWTFSVDSSGNLTMLPASNS